MNPRNLLIWSNAVFDNEESEGSASISKCSWSNFEPGLVNLSSDSLQSDCSKENVSPVLLKTPTCVKSTQPIKPLHLNSPIGRSLGKPLKLLFKEGLLEPFSEVSKEGIEVQEEIEEVCNKKKIDKEMQEIEEEINRLSSRLESLRLVKAEQSMKAKFMEPNHSIKNLEQKRVENLPSSTKTKIHCRGVSLGPAEIIAGAGLRRIKQEITPVHPIQNRRKSCFWKLQDIDELRATKERRKSLSVSPKLNKTMNKVQAATTVGYLSKKPMKKEDGILSSIQPKKLFKDGEKSVPAKKPMKTGRVVASRYNQISYSTNDVRKRSWPEDDKDEGKRCDKKRLSRVNVWESCKSQGTERKVKKKWEIPSELVVYQSVCEVEKSPLSVVVPSKIKTLRCDHETPRDSGPAKRVAELVGRKSYFCDKEEQVEGSVCQVLSFTEETVESWEEKLCCT